MFDFLEKILVALLYEQFSKRERGELSHRPLDLQSNALPLSTLPEATPLIFQNVFFKTMLLA